MTEIPKNSDNVRERLTQETLRQPDLTVLEVAALARCEHKRVRRAIASGQMKTARVMQSAARSLGIAEGSANGHVRRSA